ncbi:MAG: PEGA domain-containing protein [Myxococcaceae bacterium]|nr:PEGA domain-containing protein [Myxococcaceae bacterium]
MLNRLVVITLSSLALAAHAAPRTLVVGAGDCQSVELVTGLNDFSAALRQQLKADLYEPDVVLDIVRPRPTRSLEDVERQVESARTLFYNGQNDRALDLLKQALVELERAPIAGQPWKVTAQALTLQGVLLLGANKKADAAESFKRVLRVEPTYALNSDEYTPGVLSQFEAYRKELARTRRSPLMVQSTSPGAEVLVEGRVMGVTPLKLDLAAGSYRVLLRERERMSFLRVLTVPRDTQLQVDLAAEGALSTQAPLCLAAKDKLAEAAALKLANTVTADDLLVVRLEGAKGVPGQFVASRYEIRSGSMLREGRVQTPSRGKPAFGALATFVLTGQGSSVIVSPESAAPETAAKKEPATPSGKPVEPAVSTTPRESPPPPPAGPTRMSTARLVSFVLAGAGVAAIGAGVGVFVVGDPTRARLASLRQANGKLPEPLDAGHREALDLIIRADANQTLAFVLLGAGAGLVGAGALSFFLFPGEVPVSATVVPLHGGGAAVLSGRF